MCNDSLSRHARIELTQVVADDEGWWHVRVTAADGTYAVEQDGYVYPGDLLEWAGRLSRFPKDATDEVRFEIGDRGSVHWAWLRAWLVDRPGHAAMTVDLGRSGDDLYRRSASFAFRCDVASLNRLGEAVQRWVDNPTTPLREPLYVS